MRRSIIAIGLAVLLSGAGSAFGGYQIHWCTNSDSGSGARDLAMFEKELEIDRAQAAFSSAHAIAQRNLSVNAELDQARDALRTAHRVYDSVLRDTQLKLETRADIHEQIVKIRQMERRLDATIEPRAHFQLAADLLAQRSQLSAAEWDALSTDPDVTVAKSQYLQAANDLNALKQRQAALVLGDNQVAAAREHLLQLRHQLAYGG